VRDERKPSAVPPSLATADSLGIDNGISVPAYQTGWQSSASAGSSGVNFSRMRPVGFQSGPYLPVKHSKTLRTDLLHRQVAIKI